MWRHYRKSHTGTWDPCEESQSERVAEELAYHMTMLAVDVLGEDADYSKAKYYGDFVIDIDVSNNKDHPEVSVEEALSIAIDSAHKVVDFLAERCTPTHFQIFASGQKGFHIVIPAGLMLSKKAGVRDLFAIYKEMALYIKAESGAIGIDEGMYAGKRGHMVRVPNKQREDGAYKVQITYDEFCTITPERYKEYCTKPRPLLQQPRFLVNAGLKVLMEMAKQEMERKRNLALHNPGGIPEEFLEGFGTDHHPECVKRVVNWTHPKEEVNFHQVTHQLAIYLDAVKPPQADFNTLVNAFAESGQSSMYSTPESRKTHLTEQVLPFVKGKYKFSCAGMSNIVDTRNKMCQGCPVKAKTTAEARDVTGIEEDEDGYLAINGDGVARRLMYFHIVIVELYAPIEQVARLSSTWDGGMFRVTIGGEIINEIELHRKVFTSAKDFIEAFDFTREGSIRVTDFDVRNLLDYLLKQVKGIESMRISDSVGLRNITYVNEDNEESKQMTWVEDGFSTSSSGIAGTIKLVKKVKNVCTFQSGNSLRELPAEHEEVLTNLLNCNEPANVGRLLGWVVAAQVKEHIIDRVREFPLLNLVGVAGSGKTMTGSLFAALGAADYRHPPAMADAMSAVPARELAYTSTSIPRLIDECSKSKVSYLRWQVIREVLKGCYQQSAMEIGGISSKKKVHETHGAVVYSYRATAPIMYMATTEPNEQELKDRSLEIMLNKNPHRVPLHKEAFNALNSDPKAWELLFEVARVLTMVSLKFPSDTVYTMFEEALEKMPESFSMRARKSNAYVFLGLKFFRNTMATVQASDEFLAKVDEIESATWQWLYDNETKLSERSIRTELDNFFEKVAQGCSRITNNGQPQIRKGVHYVREGNMLYLDVAAIFGEYRDLCRWVGQAAEFNSANQIITAMEHNDFYHGTTPIAKGLSGLNIPMSKVDIKILQERGNDCSRFEE